MSAFFVSPLRWPTHWPRSDYWERARFDTSMSKAATALVRELELMGVAQWNIDIFTNVPARKDGYLRKDARRPVDPGVAVYFIRDGQELCIPCDKWDRVEDNLQAIRKTIEALRGLERWGAKHMVDAAFQGFDALPAHSATGWWDVLGVDRNGHPNDIKGTYKALLMTHHPDRRGDGDKFREIHQAYEEFKRDRGLS